MIKVTKVVHNMMKTSICLYGKINKYKTVTPIFR